MKPALLLVDLQNDFLGLPGLQPPAHLLIPRAAALLSACRKRRIPVIHIWTSIQRDEDRRLPHWRLANRWMCVVGTNGHNPPEPLRAMNGETIVPKTGFNPFASGNLESALRAMGCDTAVIAGVHLHACVRITAVESLERGYSVFVAEDAAASNDPIHAAATRRWLTQRCVSFDSSSGILSRLAGEPTAFIHRSPRRLDEVLFRVPVADEREIASATAAARESRRSWGRTDYARQREFLDNVAVRIEASAPALARQMAVEIGKPVSHGIEEIRRSATNIRDVVHRAAANVPFKKEAVGVIRHQPLGVVGLISAWNNPVAIPLGKIAPALAYGNTVVWKPAPAATHIAETLLRILHETGLPENIVRLVTGDQTSAQALAADKNIDAVTLTGSFLAGHTVQEICARRSIPLQAELSGNNAAIVWDDADVEHVAAQIASGAFGFAGQRCTANRRAIVSSAVFEAFLSALGAAGKRLVWADPLENATDIGPVINSTKRDETLAMLAAADADPAISRVLRLHHSHASESWVKAGAYVQPTIICCDEPQHPVVQEETMSPVLVVQRANDFEHALALCNGARHGLIAALFSQSPNLQHKFLEEAKAGVLKLNASTAGVDVSLPFGGWKSSGIGPPEHGDGDMRFYTRMQAVYGNQ